MGVYVECLSFVVHSTCPFIECYDFVCAVNNVQRLELVVLHGV